MKSGHKEYLFSYGTLRYEEVQIATFGRKLTGKADQLPCYRLDYLRITNPEVVATSGEDVHPVIEFSGNPKDLIAGMVFEVSLQELKQADEYEVTDYKRVKVPLLSGISAWVYIRR